MVRNATLDGASRQRVEAAISDAEKASSAEFVVIVARRSGRYDRSEDIFGLLVGLGALASLAWSFPEPAVSGSWETGPGIGFGLPLALVVVAAGFALGAMLATRFPILARPFRTRAEMLGEVRTRAADCFTNFRLRDADGRGILIYVSLLERAVWITADDAVARSVEPGLFDGVRDQVVEGMRKGSLADALTGGIGRAAAGLAKVLPPSPDAPNRIANTIRFVD